MVKGLRHTGLVIRDIDKAFYFYRDLLGFSVFKDAFETGPFIEHILGLPGIKVRTIKMHCGKEGLLELLYFDNVPAAVPGQKQLTQQGFTHIALTVDNISRLYDQLIKAGIVFVSVPKVSPDGHAKVAFCRDLEGNYLELVEEIR
jgi:catechol 2,3-dioxygenase-like lactoylglutathione lyase family enzyme